jgi:hypothetical protein
MSNTTHSNRAHRLDELRAAFSRLVDAVPELSFISLDGDGNGSAGANVAVRLVGEHAPEVVLIVDPHKADVTAHSGDGVAGRRASTLIHDILTVRLTDGFAWNDAFCGTADELAYLLLKHMRRRLKAAGEYEPDLPSGDGHPSRDGAHR